MGLDALDRRERDNGALREILGTYLAAAVIIAVSIIHPTVLLFSGPVLKLDDAMRGIAEEINQPGSNTGETMSSDR